MTIRRKPGVKVTGQHKEQPEEVPEKAEMHVVRLRNTNKI